MAKQPPKLPPKTKTLVDSMSKESEIRTKQINSLSKQINMSNQKMNLKQKDLSNKISSLSKTEKEHRKKFEKIKKDTGSTQGMSSVVPEVNTILTQIGYTIQNLAQGVQKITISTANASKEAVSQYGRAISQDISINRQNTIAMSLAQATPLFGYFAAKFMETDVFKDAAKRIKDTLGNAIKYVGVGFKNTLVKITKSTGQTIGDFFHKKQKVEYSKESRTALGKLRKTKADQIPKMAAGGYVKKGGTVQLHKAEVVMPIEKILDRIDNKVETNKLSEKITSNLSMLSEGMASMEDFVKTRGKKEDKGLIKSFVTAFKQAKNVETMKWQDRLLKATLELKIGLIGMTSRIRIAWQRTLVEHPVFRNLLMVGDMLKSAFSSPLKFLFGIRGGYRGEVSKATRTNNVFLKISNLLGLLYSGTMIRLDNLVKYTKEMLEFQTGKKAIEIQDETYTVFDKLKDVLEGKSDKKPLKEKLFDEIVDRLNLSKSSLARAGITKELNLGEIKSKFDETKEQVKTKADFKNRARSAYRSMKDKLGGVNGPKIPGADIGDVAKGTKEIIAHRGEMILPVHQVIEMIKTFSQTVTKLVKTFKPIDILKNILLDIKSVVKNVGNKLIQASKDIAGFTKEKAIKGYEAVKEFDPLGRAKRGIEKGYKRGKKFVKEDIPEKAKAIYAQELSRAKKAQELEKNKMPYEFNKPDYTKDTKSANTVFTFFERIRQKSYNRFLKKQEEREQEFLGKQKDNDEKFQKEYSKKFNKMNKRYDDHLKETEKSYAGFWNVFTKVKERREEKYRQHDEKMSTLRENLDTKRENKLSRMKEFAAIKVAGLQNKIFRKGQKDQLNIQDKYNTKILKYQKKQNNKTIKYAERVDKTHKNILKRIFNKQTEAEDKHLKKMTKIEKIQDNIEKKRIKAENKISTLKEKIENRKIKFENKLAAAKAKVEMKEKNRLAKMQGKLKLMQEKRAAKEKMKLDKLKFKLEAPMRKQKEKEAKEAMKQKLIDMKKELKEAKEKAKQDKIDMKASLKKAKQEEWEERKGLIAQRWKQLTSFPKKMDEFQADAKKRHKEDYKNAREQIEQLSKIKKYSMKIGDGISKVGAGIKKMGKGIWKYILMGLSVVKGLFTPALGALVSFLPAIAMGIGSLGKGLLGAAWKGIKGLGVGGVAGIAGVAMAGKDAYEGVGKARDWHGVREGEKVKTSQKVTSGIGGFLGGTEGQFTAKGAMSGVAKGALLGAGIGSIVPGIGTAIGGAVGAIAGGIMGFVGGENIAKGLQFVWNKLKGMVSAVWDFVKYPIVLMGELAKKGWEWIKETAKEKWENFKTNLGVVVDFYAKPFKYIGDLVEKGWHWIKNRTKENWNNFVSDLTVAMEFMKKPFSFITDLLEKAGSYIMDKLKSIPGIGKILSWFNKDEKPTSAAESAQKGIKDGEAIREKKVYENQKVPDEFGQPIVPVNSGLITSKFGPRNTGLVGASRMHKGIDMRAPMGEPVRAMWGGKVVEAGGPWGIVGVKHSKDYTSKYVHLSGIGAEVGDSVHAGDVIGRAGKTGPIRGMASHLHLGLKHKGTYVDPNETFKANGINLALKGSKREIGGEVMDSPTGNSINMKQLAQNGVNEKLSESKYAAGLYANATGKMADKLSDGVKKTNAAVVYSTNIMAATSANMSNMASSGNGSGSSGPSSFSSGDGFVNDILKCNIS